jgi:hypothetical protein
MPRGRGHVVHPEIARGVAREIAEPDIGFKEVDVYDGGRCRRAAIAAAAAGDGPGQDGGRGEASQNKLELFS